MFYLGDVLNIIAECYVSKTACPEFDPWCPCSYVRKRCVYGLFCFSDTRWNDFFDYYLTTKEIPTNFYLSTFSFIVNYEFNIVCNIFDYCIYIMYIGLFKAWNLLSCHLYCFNFLIYFYMYRNPIDICFCMCYTLKCRNTYKSGDGQEYEKKQTCADRYADL